jgi:hypothetical protein
LIFGDNRLDLRTAGDPGRRPAELVGDLSFGPARFRGASPRPSDSSRTAEVLALQVLGRDQDLCVGVAHFDDEGLDRLEARDLGGSPPPLAGDDLESALLLGVEFVARDLRMVRFCVKVFSPSPFMNWRRVFSPPTRRR